MTLRLLSVFAVASLIAGCGDDSDPVDSSVPDTSVADTSVADTAVADTSVTDTSEDAPVEDTSVPDTLDAPTTGTVSGNLTASVTCASAAGVDCMGDVYVVIFDADIPWTSGTVASVRVADADLSDGAGIGFTVLDVPPGDWFLGAFQDDDANATPETPLPSLGDPALTGTLPVTVMAGAAATQDVVLNLRVP